MESLGGWRSRGYLPHYDPGAEPQFVTWRLIDSLPMGLYERWKLELQAEDDPVRARELYRRAERYLDAGHGSCMLRELSRREIVGNAIRFYHGYKYTLHAYVVMPNHVHVLFTPHPGISVANIIGPLKSFMARELNRKFGGSGAVWQPDYFDRWIRNEEHLERVRKYIEWNPVKAGLCFDPKLWMQSSASLPIA